MALADQLAKQRDLILADLDRVHDYYTHTKGAWQVVLSYPEQGESLIIRNTLTGNVLTEENLSETAQFYVDEYLLTTTFQQIIGLFEDFIFGLLREWLLAYPARVGRRQLAVADILAASDIGEVKLLAVNRELNELNYKKVREWFAYLDGMVKLGCPTPDEIDRLAEAKATRDVFVHNRGVANAVYVEKAGAKKRCGPGERLPMPEPYHRETWELVRRVVADVSAAAIAKAA
jgi:hypothetical protein